MIQFVFFCVWNNKMHYCIHSQVDKAAIAELEDGLYAVNFVPCEMGIHTVSERQSGLP